MSPLSKLFEPVPTRKQAASQLTLFAVWLFVTVTGLILHADPSGHGTHTQLGLPPCPSALLFDRPCPGCGLTTSFTALLHGQWGLAFSAHPLGPFLYLGITIWALLGMYGWLKAWRLDGSGRTFNRAIAAFAIAFFGFGVVRMILVPNYGGVSEGRFIAVIRK